VRSIVYILYFEHYNEHVHRFQEALITASAIDVAGTLAIRSACK